MIALDTNVLVYAHRSLVAEHAGARRAILEASRNPDGWGIPSPCLVEFWSVVTHPQCTGKPSSPQEAAAFVNSLRAAGAELWQPGAGFPARLLRIVRDLDLRGPRIFDLQIALTALDNGAVEIWTYDRNFAALPGIRVRHLSAAGH
ncbi:MAG: PIN domain-containing protein [Bryobacteraceae bacterium]|nr:PIN domain-containing protein [Bryobacteraceae bacterium]